MFRQYLDKIEGIGAYPLFSFIVFFVFFLAVTLWVFKADKKQLDEMSRLPLQNNDPDNTKTDPA
jgi:cbb3-type cytochrome oxidase subunit 3